MLPESFPSLIGTGHLPRILGRAWRRYLFLCDTHYASLSTTSACASPFLRLVLAVVGYSDEGHAKLSAANGKNHYCPGLGSFS